MCSMALFFGEQRSGVEREKAVVEWLWWVGRRDMRGHIGRIVR